MQWNLLKGAIVIGITLYIVLDSIKKVRAGSDHNTLYALAGALCGIGGLILAVAMLTGNW